jgi:phosphatidylglycerophosphatase A
MNFKDRLAIFLATACNLGNMPFAPGTFGSLLGLPICFFLSKLHYSLVSIIILAFLFMAIRIAGKAEYLLNKRDPSCIIIDEIAGLLLSLYAIRFNMLTCAIGFILFRFFDIAKPFPIRQVEKRLKGGYGIVMDDVLAGIYSNLVLRIIILLFKN